MKLSSPRNTLSICIALIVLLSTGDVLGETEKTLLLFADDKTFLPQIEATLKSMRNSETDQRLFSRVINVNTWSANRFEKRRMDELVRFYESSPELRRKSFAELQSDSVLIHLIKDADCYIHIDVLSKLPLLEFQLIVSDSLPHTQSREYPILITDSSHFEGFTIDISRPDFPRHLKNALKRIFPESNQPPVPIVKTSKGEQSDGYYYFEVSRPFVLDASNSYDLDTPLEHLEYSWRQVNPTDRRSPLSRDEIVTLDSRESLQNLRIEKTGEYWFILNVNDGVCDSEELQVKIRIVEPPRLTSRPRHVATTYAAFRGTRSFNVPFTCRCPLGVSATIEVVSIELKQESLQLLDILKKPERPWLEGDTGQCAILLLSDSLDSSHTTSHYDLQVTYGSGRNKRHEYRILLVARTDRSISDTLIIHVDHEDRSYMSVIQLGSNLHRCRFDTTWINRRTVSLNGAWRAHVNHSFAIEWGWFVPYYREKIDNSSAAFRETSSYIAFSYEVAAASVHFSGAYVGVGHSLDFGSALGLFPVVVELVHWPKGARSGSVKIGFESTQDWFWLINYTVWILRLAGL